MIPEIEHLVAAVRRTPGCTLMPPRGLPRPGAGHALPPDVRRFYALAGGAVLHEGADHEIRILAPEAVVPANPVLVGESGEGDRSAAWYLIARDGGGDYLTVDFSPERLGRCYDSHHEIHGLVGQTPVIARSFAELLARLHAARGEQPYWLDADWVPLGDAYDDEPLAPA